MLKVTKQQLGIVTRKELNIYLLGHSAEKMETGVKKAGNEEDK